MKPEEMRDDIPIDVREELARLSDVLPNVLEAVLRPNPRTVHLPAADLPAPLKELPASGRCWSWYWSHNMEGVIDYTRTREQLAEGLYFATRADAEAWLAHLQSWKRPGADWTPHTPGDPMPCDGESVVVIKMRDGTRAEPSLAHEFDWRDDDDPGDITAWRYAREGEA